MISSVGLVGKWGKTRKWWNALKEYLQTETAAGRWGYKTALEVAPGLVAFGRKNQGNIPYKQGTVPSPCEATLQWNFLGANPGQGGNRSHSIGKPDGRGGQAAVIELSARNSLAMGASCGAIGDEQLSRMLAVIGDGLTPAWSVAIHRIYRTAKA